MSETYTYYDEESFMPSDTYIKERDRVRTLRDEQVRQLITRIVGLTREMIRNARYVIPEYITSKENRERYLLDRVIAALKEGQNEEQRKANRDEQDSDDSPATD